MCNKLAEVLLITWAYGPLPQYQMTEVFSGVGSIAKHYREKGLRALEYDYIRAKKTMDFLRPAGYAFLDRLAALFQLSW